jgi:hypothetical protein
MMGDFFCLKPLKKRLFLCLLIECFSKNFSKITYTIYVNGDTYDNGFKEQRI